MMFPSTSHPHKANISGRFRQSGSDRLAFSASHSTVNCEECNRSMVPRVVNYRGQPLKSICPFCGATFAKFPSGLQRFLQSFHSRELSFDATKRILLCATITGIVFYACSKGLVSKDYYSFLLLSTCFFSVLASVELTYQGVERLAKKLLHNSNYYWALLILATCVLISKLPEVTVPLIIFFGLMLVRFFFVGLSQAVRKN